MAKYTIEIRTLYQDPSFKLFDFKYDFYNDSEVAKAEFEQKFIQHYLFHEIGFETVYRFKECLKDLLRIKMPYYKQLYATELRAKEIDFMLNKDYVEEFTKNIKSEDNEDIENKGNTEASTDGSVIINNTLKNEYRESSLDNGIANTDIENNLTTHNKNDGFNVSNNVETTKNKIDNMNNTKTKRNYDNKEDYKLIGKGNIGITSSAQLLKEWREVLINIDEIIINDCRNLFLKIY